jgi:hypothetical protein
MAQKRMFDKSIIETDEFMDMSMTTKALYFLLGMEADDEGFVSPKRVMRIYGGSEDDLKVLIAKNYCIAFQSGVVVITNWHENNYLDKKRVKTTRYQTEKKLLALEKGKYKMLNNSLTDVKQMLRENRIEENRIEENRIEENSVEEKHNLAYARLLTEGKQTKEFEDKYLISKDEVIDIAEQLVNYVTSTGKRYKNYKATMHNWIKRKYTESKNNKKSPELLILSGKVIN